jgi:hypothetical protein
MYAIQARNIVKDFPGGEGPQRVLHVGGSIRLRQDDFAVDFVGHAFGHERPS